MIFRRCSFSSTSTRAPKSILLGPLFFYFSPFQKASTAFPLSTSSSVLSISSLSDALCLSDVAQASFCFLISLPEFRFFKCRGQSSIAAAERSSALCFLLRRKSSRHLFGILDFRPSPINGGDERKNK